MAVNSLSSRVGDVRERVERYRKCVLKTISSEQRRLLTCDEQYRINAAASLQNGQLSSFVWDLNRESAKSGSEDGDDCTAWNFRDDA